MKAIITKYIECRRALDLSYREGRKILERYGWSHDNQLEPSETAFVSENRFELSAIEFVNRLLKELESLQVYELTVNGLTMCCNDSLPLQAWASSAGINNYSMEIE